MKRQMLVLLWGVLPVVCACDLQPRISSISDSVGDFISERYPAMLADPTTQAEIYESAVTDYGVYASPELYGSDGISDYVLYASVDDYIIPPSDTTGNEYTNNATTKTIAVNVSDTSGTTTDINKNDEYEGFVATDDVIVVGDDGNVDYGEEQSPENDFLIVPTYGTPPVATTRTVVVAKGDTLYKIAKANGVSVDEMAQENNLKSPYALRIGQNLRVPHKSDSVAPVSNIVKDAVAPKPQQKSPTQSVTKTTQSTVTKQAESTATKKSDNQTQQQKVLPQQKQEPKVVATSKTTTTRVGLKEITVGAGDTLYSLSRQYSVPVNDLAVMNDISAPFALRAGQKIKVPDLHVSDVRRTDNVAAVAKTGTSVRSVESVKTTKQQTAPKADTKKQTQTTSTKTSVAKQTKTKTQNATSVQTKKTTQQASTKQSQKQQAQKNKNTNTNAGKKQTVQKTTKSADVKKQTSKIAARSSSKFSWPVRGTILSHFGSKGGGLFNDGINIAASRGTSVKAAENGIVAYAGNEVKGMGNLVIIQHADGWMTVYAHMNSMSVRRGTQVSVGSIIGTVGSTGKVDKPQLHFEIRKGTRAYNPSSYLKK